ncbi:MAG: hypothetical protein WCE82_10865 [Halobacteriota archaeon]
MIQNGLILTGTDAEILSQALLEMKTKAYAESETSLDDTQALTALVSCAEKGGQEKEEHHPYRNLLSKRLVLGTLVGRASAEEK